jgi:hypothetical protein
MTTFKQELYETIKNWANAQPESLWKGTRNHVFNEQDNMLYDGRYSTIFSTQEVFDKYLYDMGASVFGAISKSEFTHGMTFNGYTVVVRKREKRNVRCFAKPDSK